MNALPDHASLEAPGSTHTRAEPQAGIRPMVHSVLAVYSSKEPNQPIQRPEGRGINISGVDFWHAVEFSRNGRFLRIPLRTLRALPSGTSCSRLYQIFARPLSCPFSYPNSPAGGAFPFLRFRLYQNLSAPIPSRSGIVIAVLTGPFRRPNPSGFSRATHNRVVGGNFDIPKFIPLGILLGLVPLLRRE
jgi:hypothetical protein